MIDFPALLQNILPLMGARESVGTEERLKACADWFVAAHKGAGDGGVSAAYDLVRQKWLPSYPETTGYIIPSLLNMAKILKRPELVDTARVLGEFLLDQRSPEGAISHWSAKVPLPVVFDTGQVMFGWIALYEELGEERFLQAAEKAGRWLLDTMDDEGGWSQGQHLGVKKTIDSRVTWALLCLQSHVHIEGLEDKVRRTLDWVVAQQLDNGWYRNAAFEPGQDPYTHTIVYTAEGLFECGLILHEEKYIAAARATQTALLEQQRSDGYLASTFGSSWQPSAHSACLTGMVQASKLWRQLGFRDDNKAFMRGATLALNYASAFQRILSARANIRGALPGSAPCLGGYERLKYPNWATKFLADALMVQWRLDRDESIVEPYRG